MEVLQERYFIEQFISRCWVFTPIDIAISVSTLYLTESSPPTTRGSSARCG